MEEVAGSMKNNVYPLDKFVITKSLTKAVHMYADGGAQPHARVAIEMIKQGHYVVVGDYIPYVICEGTGTLADKAYHPSSVMAAGSPLKLDYEWYLTHQILPPIARLCEPIEGMHSKLLAESLGLDASKFSETRAEENSEDLFALDLYDYDDEEAFKDLKKIEFTCRYCQRKSTFEGLCVSTVVDGELINGLQCPTLGCIGFIADQRDASRLSNCAIQLAKKCITQFYQQVIFCDDMECPLRFGTRRLPKYPNSPCFRAGCSGRLQLEVLY